jgi:hypothetical protein
MLISPQNALAAAVRGMGLILDYYLFGLVELPDQLESVLESVCALF